MLSTLLLSVAGLGDDAPAPLFREVGEAALPGVATVCGSPTKEFIIEVNGGGVALADFDRDGVLDLVVVDGSTIERVEEGLPGFPPRLFLGRGDGTFEPAGEEWAMAGGRWGMGCAVGDVDEDGFPDLFVTEWGPDRLFLNEGGEGFREATADAGFQDERWGTSAAFLDYDGDGHLDLYVVNYLYFDADELRELGTCSWRGKDVMCGPEGRLPVFDQLYRGRGDGTFEDVTRAAGVRPDAAGYGLGVTTLDVDDDGDTDLYVTNDSTPNHLWENQGDGTFREVGFRSAVSHDASGREQAGMGIAVGDLDGDGAQDLFVTNFSGETNSLYVSGRRGRFRERSTALGLRAPSLRLLGWGTGFGDLDLDGELDLFVLNGHVYPQADLPGTDTTYAQPDQAFLYRREGERARFVERPLSDAGPTVARAGALADLDRDGDLDLVALSAEGPVRVLENRAPRPEGARWIAIALEGRGGNRAGLGARLELEVGGRTRRAQVRTAGGYQAAVPPEAHFGLGAVQGPATLTVRWPSGTVQTVEGIELDRRHVVVEPPPEEEGDGAEEGR